MQYSPSFITGAANTVSHGVVWIPASYLYRGVEDGCDKGRKVIAYLVANSVAIVDDRTTRVLCTLRSPLLQEDNLTCIACVLDENRESVCLVTGSEKGVVSLWTLPRLCEDDNVDALTQWTLSQSITDCKASVTTLTAHAVPTTREIVVVASDAAGACVVYRSLSVSPSLSPNDPWLGIAQQMHFPAQQLPNAAHLFSLSSHSLCLSLGGVDAKLHLYVSDVSTTCFALSFASVGVLAGHEEWITSISSLALSPSATFLASSSQDNKIRIWKIVLADKTALSLSPSTLAEDEKKMQPGQDEGEDEESEDEDESDENAKSAAPAPLEDETLSGEARLRFLAHRESDDNEEDEELFLVFLEALLIGHEDWVTAVHWLPVPQLSPSGENAKLFSTSMDRNMVVWSPDATAGGVWEPVVRVGDIGGALGGSIGGNLLGFVGGCASPDGDALLGIGYGGSFHYWQRSVARSKCAEVESSGESVLEQRWSPRALLTGHFDVVTDIAWEQSQGAYLVSVSSDQTCRLFAPLSATISPQPLWKEISRPEIHGYDLNCIVTAPNSFEILTGGEEKLIRGFDAPNLVQRGLKELCGLALPFASAAKVEQAYIPELGLSNKGKEMMTIQEIQEQEARGVSAISWTSPPLESQLSDHTLWLETHKMFGHNNEVVCMTRSSCGKWLASSSKARYSHSCFVLLWSLDTYSLIDKLPGHESTASCVEFSPDGRFLASSGKDRSICVYSQLEDPTTGDMHFTPVLCFKNAHKRIVWDLSWTPDGQYLITACRDGTSKVWKVISNEDGSVVTLEPVHTFSPFNGVAVTAVDIEKCVVDENNWRAVFGAENGSIQQWAIHRVSGEPSLVLEVPSRFCHSKAVKRLTCKPNSRPNPEEFEWASCSEDKTVRIHRTTAK